MLDFLKKHISKILLLFFVVIAIFTYQDYGLSSDERVQRELGKHCYNFIAHGDQTYKVYLDNDYGVAFELAAYIVTEKILGLDNFKDIFEARHLFAHLLFLLGVFCFSLFLDKKFKNKWLTLLGVLFIVLSPRIYAHSFFNSKDIPLLSFTLIGIWILYEYLSKKNLKWLLALAVISAIIVNNRIIGLAFVGSTGVLFLWDMIQNKSTRIKMLQHNSIYCIFFALMLYGTWPILWENPLGELRQIFDNMAHFRWEDNVLFLGEIIKATELPWYYLPVWMLTTTPLIVVILFLAGIGLVLAKRSVLTADHSIVLWFFVFIAVPLVTIIGLNSVLYDGWRHMYFVLPSMVILALSVLQHLNKRYIYSVALVLLLLDTGVFMAFHHPYHQVYFNALMDKSEENIRHTMEADYWGTSYKQALQFVCDIDDSENILIAHETGICRYNALLLEPNDEARLKFTPTIDSAQYFISNYRWHMVKDSSFSDQLTIEPIYDVKVQNSSIMTVWKLKD